MVGVCFVFLFEVILCVCVPVFEGQRKSDALLFVLCFIPHHAPLTHTPTGGKGVQNHTWLYVGTVWGSESGPKCFYPLSHFLRLKWFAFCFKCS